MKLPSIAVFFALTAGVTLLPAQAPAPSAPAAPGAQVDSAYVTGYNDGYSAGQQDAANGIAANAHKFRLYQDASDGYTPQYGTRDTYRAAFQSGFDDGYKDGYAGRPLSIRPGPAPDAGAAPPGAPEPPPPADGAPPNPSAGENGYREGYRLGESDANQGAAYNAGGKKVFQDASVGYQPALGDAETYKVAFRDGFNAGYMDGYNHRLYNSALGGRREVEPAAAGAHLLPPNPDDARGMPPGVYANGVLVGENTFIQATLNQRISSKTAHVGDPFTMTVTVPVWVGSTQAIPAGSLLHGTVKQAVQSGKMSGSATLQLGYETLELPGRPPVPLEASTTGVGGNQSVKGDEGTVSGQPNTGTQTVAKDAGVGAVLGGIFGGYGGLLRGAVAGTVIGGAGVLTSKDKDVELKSGEAITLKLDQPLELLNGGGQ